MWGVAGESLEKAWKQGRDLGTVRTAYSWGVAQKISIAGVWHRRSGYNNQGLNEVNTLRRVVNHTWIDHSGCVKDKRVGIKIGTRKMNYGLLLMSKERCWWLIVLVI